MDDFLVYYDASIIGLDAVLMHISYVIEYALMQLQPHEEYQFTTIGLDQRRTD